MTLAEQVELACLLEATARKPGNVHPGASFVDLDYADFVHAAAAIAPVIATSAPGTVGTTVLRAIQATQTTARSNINLGIVLLLAPLAAVPREQSLADGLPGILANTTRHDAAEVYRAIRLAVPGGLGEVDDQDVADEPTQTLREVMQLAAERDQIAAQFVEDFRLVRSLAHRLQHHWQPAPTAGMPAWERAVITTFLELLAEHPDSLIIRKNGSDIAHEAQQSAGTVLHAGWPLTVSGVSALRDFDHWLRADGHRRNPGTSADLIAAALFYALREGLIDPPSQADVMAHAAAITPAQG